MIWLTGKWTLVISVIKPTKMLLNRIQLLLIYCVGIKLGIWLNYEEGCYVKYWKINAEWQIIILLVNMLSLPVLKISSQQMEEVDCVEVQWIVIFATRIITADNIGKLLI